MVKRYLSKSNQDLYHMTREVARAIDVRISTKCRKHKIDIQYPVYSVPNL